MLRAAGAVAVKSTRFETQAGFHPMGTACMGDDRETSVVDRFNRHHQVPNLYVVDAGTFVTGSCLNPTTTAMALALRTPHHIATGAWNQFPCSTGPGHLDFAPYFLHVELTAWMDTNCSY